MSDPPEKPLLTKLESDGPMLSAEPWAEVYKAIRAHEVMLNQATSAFEHAVLAPLVVLNGGAIVAFLTLIGALAEDDAPTLIQSVFVAAASMAWAAGLLQAANAVRHAYRSQRSFSKAQRGIRQDLEERLFQPPIPTIVRRDGHVDYDAAIGDALDEQGKFETAWRRSVYAFVAGAAIAVVAVLVGVG